MERRSLRFGTESSTCDEEETETERGNKIHIEIVGRCTFLMERRAGSVCRLTTSTRAPSLSGLILGDEEAEEAEDVARLRVFGVFAGDTAEGDSVSGGTSVAGGDEEDTP